MATGKKLNNASLSEGVSFQDRFNVDIADAENLACVQIFNSNSDERVIAFYKGAGAIDLTKYNGFPKGSLIHDEQAHKTHEKTGATTWVSSAARA